jgi:methylmalonyl-CoA mutase cobalamin-binding subunit
MTFSDFHKIVKNILKTPLPSGISVVHEGRLMAKNIVIGRTSFMDKMGVNSEAEYKRQCIREHKIMYHAHVGMNTWKDTAAALTSLYRAAQDSGFTVDRAGICLDRRMGLPNTFKDSIPAETGPMLASEKDWEQVGKIVPIQPHMGDFMIGFPSSTHNTVCALNAGVTTIGNLSQYFAHDIPLWRDRVTTVVETIRAMSIISALREKGVILHSYLEDGYGALFRDCSTIAGWAFLEQYITEQMLEGKLAHCIGGLTIDPIKRAGWVFALHEIHNRDSLGSMIYGDTISFTSDDSKNRGMISEYLLWDMMTQLECPTGHAVLPLPVTEAFRVPSAEEIIEAQIFGHRIEETAKRLVPYVDFSAAHHFSRQVVSKGKRVFNNALDGLKEAGVNIHDPVELLYVLKELGPAVFEKMFGVPFSESDGKKDPGEIPTDIYLMSKQCVHENRHLFTRPQNRAGLEGRRILIASTDVHELAIGIIDQLLSESGVDTVNIGAEKDPDEVASTAVHQKVDAILISTHNGMALEYARQLKAELQNLKSAIPVIMGGVLNQKVEDQALPVPVSKELKSLGFQTCTRLGKKFTKMLEFKH